MEPLQMRDLSQLMHLLKLIAGAGGVLLVLLFLLNQWLQERRWKRHLDRVKRALKTGEDEPE